MRVIIPRNIAMIASLLLLLETVAWGEVRVPSTAIPDTISKSLTPRENPQPSQALPAVVSKPQPTVTPGGEEAKKIKFVLKGIILSGNHIYSDKQIAILYKDKLNKEISVTDLFAIVQDITNFYRNNGYIISRAILPPQHVKGGVVHIQIVEGFIDKVEITGKPKWSKCLIQGMGEKIKANPPLQISRMEKYLLLANEVPGAQVRAVLSPSPNKTGAADLSLLTELKTASGYFSYDNYGTRYIGPQQMTANIAFNSFARSGDATQFTMTKTPKGTELTFMDLNYNVPVDDNGTRMTFGATRATTHPLFVLTDTPTTGVNANYYASISVPIIRERAQSLTFQANVGYLDSEVNILGEELYTDHLRNLGLSAFYNFADRFYGANSVFIDMRQGLPIFGYSNDTNPSTALTSRPGGYASYTKFDAQMTRLQAIKGAFSLYGTLRGQYAFQPLLASEQFSFGGSQLGRGYDVAELIGDKGAAGGIELRYDLAIGRYLQSLQLYTFYDAGMIWNYNFISGTPRVQSATSTGFGTRFYFNKYITGNLMWTQVLTKEVASEGLIGDGWRPRVFFSVIAAF